MNFKSLFQTNNYLKTHSDLPFKGKKSAWNHFQSYGWKEGRTAAFENIKIFNDYVSSRKEDIFIHLTGGFGNQLFMIFNGISLAHINHRTLKVFYDKNYIEKYKKNRNTTRKSSLDYQMFKLLEFEDVDESTFKKKQIFIEPEYQYNPITSINDKSLIKGFFQSYKYFWDCKEIIKKKLFINYDLIDKINSLYKSFKKPVLSIHVRLGDYVNLPDYHPIPP